MTRTRHTEEPIIAVHEDAQAGLGIKELCRKHGISDATCYKWRAKFAGLEVSDVKKLRQLEEENRRLKQMVADQALDIPAPKSKRAAAPWVAARQESDTAGPARSSLPAVLGRVVGVTDGDTITILHTGERIRPNRIDCPEKG